MSALILGMGQLGGGDDGVGLAVIDALRLQGVPASYGDPTRLVEALGACERVVLVDALLGEEPGRVRVLREDQLSGARPVSSHAMSVPQAVGLARALEPDGAELVIVGVEIFPPRPGMGLSEAVAAAVPLAAATARSELEGVGHA